MCAYVLCHLWLFSGLSSTDQSCDYSFCSGSHYWFYSTYLQTWNCLSPQIYMLLHQLLRFFLFLNFGWTAQHFVFLKLFFFSSEFSSWLEHLEGWQYELQNAACAQPLAFFAVTEPQADVLSRSLQEDEHASRFDISFPRACVCCRRCCLRLQRACGLFLSLKSWR